MDIDRDRDREKYFIDFFYCLLFHDVTAQIDKILPESLGPTNKLNYAQHIVFQFFANSPSIYVISDVL